MTAALMFLLAVAVIVLGCAIHHERRAARVAKLMHDDAAQKARWVATQPLRDQLEALHPRRPTETPCPTLTLPQQAGRSGTTPPRKPARAKSTHRKPTKAKGVKS